jgi:tetraacyldisaccharide 4'-kinase
VICCGNVTSGGAGKTTVALDLGQRLRDAGVNVHFLSRGHGGTARGPLRVDPARHDAGQVGDEPLLLAAVAPAWIGADRAASARLAVEAGAEALVLDDGLQNPTLHKDFSFLVIDGASGFGNGRLIPAGPLRESVASAARRCGAAVLIGEDQADAVSDLPAGLRVLRARLRPDAATLALAGQRVLAFAGIARPEKFHATLEQAGAVLAARMDFADHHRFRPAELDHVLNRAAQLGALPVTTPKDAARLPPDMRARVTVAGVLLEWQDPDALMSLLSPLFPGRPAWV